MYDCVLLYLRDLPAQLLYNDFVDKSLAFKLETGPQVIYNSHYSNEALAMFTLWYYLEVKGKHCRKPHCHNGAVDHFGPGLNSLLDLQLFHSCLLSPLRLKKPTVGLFYPL